MAEADITSVVLDVLDEEGLDGFTMRKLATRLGVTPMVVYSNYRNKEALLEAVATVRLVRSIYPMTMATGRSLSR